MLSRMATKSDSPPVHFGRVTIRLVRVCDPPSPKWGSSQYRRYLLTSLTVFRILDPGYDKGSNDMANIEPLKKPVTLKEQAYEKLKSLVLNRTLVPGQAMTEVSLSQSLGISRTPVRQALSRLASEGLIVEVDGRLQVRLITRKESEDVAELRMAIEGHTSRLLSRMPMDARSLESARGINQAMASLLDSDGTCRDLPEFFQYNREFHLEMVGLTHNTLLIEATAHVLDLVVLSGLNALTSPRRASEVIDEHNRILDAIQSGQDDLAYQCVSDHVFDHFRSDCPDDHGVHESRFV